MPDLVFTQRMGTHLSEAEAAEAAGLLSRGYTKWQNNPANTNPVKTDTSPEVYRRIMSSGVREVVMGYDGDTMVGVFVQSLSPQYDQYPLRKLSYLAAVPLERGFEALKRVFGGYAAYMVEQGEDVVITTDLDQGTLNSLLEFGGFRECVDRNETYYILSQLLSRKLISSQKVAGDFVVDEIIRIDGKSIRRSKKLFKLQTTPLDFYNIYTEQQWRRLERSIPEPNRENLVQAMAHSDDGIFFIADYAGCVSLRDPRKGGFDHEAEVFGPQLEQGMRGLTDPGREAVLLRPRGVEEIRAIAGKVVLRPGLFDFISYCFKVLGSFFVVSEATPVEVEAVLGRALHPDVQLRYSDLVEHVFVPEVEPMPSARRVVDGEERTPWRFQGPYAAFDDEGFTVRKDRMVADILALRRGSRAPVVFLTNRGTSLGAMEVLYAAAREHRIPVLVFDFGTRVTAQVSSEFFRGDPAGNPWFSLVGIRDYYQIPVMLEALGLRTERGVDLNVAF